MIVFSESEFNYFCDIVDFYSDLIGANIEDPSKYDIFCTLKTKLNKANKLGCKTLISDFEKLKLF